MQKNSRKILAGLCLCGLFVTVYGVSGLTAGIRTPAVILPKVDIDAVAKFKFPSNTTITGTQMVSGETVTVNGVKVGLPVYCKVLGRINQRMGKGLNGPAEYYIGFELRLPAQWNGRFFFEGGGGSDGVIKNPVGMRQTGDIPALARGFATVATDAGHQGNGCQFGIDPQARVDYAYNAIDKVAVTAKSIIKDYYGQAPRYSYFVGGSNGGRQGFMFAQRFPNYFDGIVCGAPGFNMTNAAVAEMWTNQIVAKISQTDANGQPLMYTAFSDADLKLVADAILRQLDAADGLVDGLVFNISAARKFDPATLPQKTATSTGLTANQIDALKRIFQGPVDSKGNQLYSNWPWDPGIADAGWRHWILGTEQTPARNVSLGVESTARTFTTPFAMDYDPAKPLQWALAFNFDTDPAKTALTASYLNARSTNLQPFKHSQGKLLIYHGMGDPVFSAYDTIDYYNQLMKRNGGLKATQQFARLFLFPGMSHVNGGPATDQFDGLTAIQDWVEKGKAPNQIVASGSRGGNFESVKRPIFPYPLQTYYDGKGDANAAASFYAK